MSQTRWGVFMAAMLLFALALPAAAQAAQCPNEQLRREDNSLQLPECRAYEMVSPPFKNGAPIYGTEPVLTAPSGESALYLSTGAFASAPAAPIVNDYVATRGSTGWLTRPVEAPQVNEGPLLAGPTQGVSEDLTSVLQVSMEALAPGAVQGQGNIYVSNAAAGTRTLVGTSGGKYAAVAFASDIYSTYVGGSSNFSHVVFAYEYALMPGSVEGSMNIYDWTGGALHLINYLPDGTLATNVSSVGFARPSSHPVSTDGSKVFFSAEGALYVREDDARTVAISVSQRAGASLTPQEGKFVGASADGSIVYFTSYANLVEGPETTTQKLYRYDLNTGQLTAPVSTSAEVEGVLRISEGGSYVYFSALGALTPGAIQAQFGTPNTYVWHEGQGVKLVARGGYPLSGQGSPNGQHFAFLTTQQLTSFSCSGCSLLYEYDYATDSVRCVSCNPTGAQESDPVDFAPLRIVTPLDTYFSRSVLDDGTVFFDTQESLVPRDSNGQYDVYEWHDGQLSLLSGGTAPEDSFFSDASPDGANVFFKTSQALVGQDVDTEDDLYDARVDGGFPAPVVAPPCSGTGCQGTPAAPPIFATPPSETFAGVGNFEPALKLRSKPKPAATKAQKLKAALKLCRRDKRKRQRRTCEKRARKAYGGAVGKRAKTSSTKSDRRGK